MPRYHYRTSNGVGEPVSGEFEAANPDEVGRHLAEQGFSVEGAEISEVPDSSAPGYKRLSPEDTVELGSRLAELTAGELPLASGLRAVAAETPSRRLASTLREIADRVEAGEPIASALAAQGPRFPEHLRGLISAGIASGCLAEALHEFVALERERLDVRERIWMTLAYPCLLLGMTYVVFAGVVKLLAPLGELFSDFGASVSPVTQLVLHLGGVGFWVLLAIPITVAGAVGVLLLFRGGPWVWQLLYSVPLVGPICRWSSRFRFARLMAVLLDQERPLADAFRLTAAGLREADLSSACFRAAHDIEQGRSLAATLASHNAFPASLGPLAEWAEKTSNPAEAFRTGAELFEGRARVHVGLLEKILPPFVFLLVVFMVFLLKSAFLGPLIGLIQNLT